MHTEIQLEKMRFYAYHGVMPQERKVGNHFEVSLYVVADLQQASESDELSHTLHYGLLYEAVNEEMQTPSKLIEHAAGRILRRIKQDFPQAMSVEVKVSKLNPPMGADIQSASFVIRG